MTHRNTTDGADLRLEFLDLGYELFQDKGRLKAHFLEADVFEKDEEAEGGKELRKLDGTINIIHAASFLHLFSWEQQVQAGIRMVRLTTGDPLVLGRQVASLVPGEYERRAKQSGTRYLHDPDSFQKLWDVIGEKTGTKWKVIAELRKVPGWQREEQEKYAADSRLMTFEVHRLE